MWNCFILPGSLPYRKGARPLAYFRFWVNLTAHAVELLFLRWNRFQIAAFIRLCHLRNDDNLSFLFVLIQKITTIEQFWSRLVFLGWSLHLVYIMGFFSRRGLYNASNWS